MDYGKGWTAKTSKFGTNQNTYIKVLEKNMIIST